MKVETVKISKVKLNKSNPRLVKDDKFAKLVKSVKEFPEMLQIRPIVVDDDMIVLGGNMRLRACREAGLKEVPIIKADELTEEQKREFSIKDNLGYGEWDWDIIANEWDSEQLTDWGMDLPVFSGDVEDDTYSKKVASPIYEAKNKKPDLEELFNVLKTKELIEKINKAKIKQEDKEFLTLAAYRHTVFNYELIADYYANSDNEVKILMEESALVIIDFKKAIEGGFVKLSEEILNEYLEEYE